MRYYIFKTIIPNDGELKEIHKELLGRRCYIVELEAGKRAIIRYEPDYDPGDFHLVSTSIVKNYTDDNGVCTIWTENTTYYLEAA